MRKRPREEERRGVARFLVPVILCLQSSVATGFLETRLLKLLKKATQLAQRELLNTSRESVDSLGATHTSGTRCEKRFSSCAIGSCDKFQGNN